MNLKEAKVLVTGGSSGIGFETAKQLIEHGAKVAICGRNKSSITKAAKKIGAFAVVADVSKEADVIRMVKTINKEFGGINVLINNAGFGTFSLLQNTTVKDFENVFHTNVIGAMLCARECAKIFMNLHTGNIINISSTAGKAGFAAGTIYTASKFALNAMTECWRAELRKHNIRVMQVNPSEVQTSFYSNAGGEDRPYNESKLQSADIAHVVLSMLQLNDRGFITDTTVWATNPQ